MATSVASSSSRAGSISKGVLLILLCASPAAAEHTGSAACRACHLAQFEAQSKTAHARALRNEGDIWRFGSGLQAVTPVSRLGTESYKEHGLTLYTRSKREGITPGHKNPAGVLYKVFDPGAQIFRCFQCHSTGPLSFTPAAGIEPFEPGVRCESCHGPGGDHVRSPSKTNIQQPKILNGTGMNNLCGNCHRQPPTTGEDTDWSDPWNARHQPLSFSQSACFRKSGGRLTCTTCHDPHGAKPVRQDACTGCHANPRHLQPVAKSQTCANCHMPLVKPSTGLQFANHWIGVYNRGSALLPAPK